MPPGWWALAVLFALTLSVAFGYYLGLGWAVGVGLPSFVAVALGFRSAAYTTEVDDHEIRVGRAVVGRECQRPVPPGRASESPSPRPRQPAWVTGGE